jgi:ADP-ribosylation factor-like protein 2
MGLLNIIRKTKEKEKEIRILILGLDNAGKTTIVKKFNGEDINTISPTLGFNIKTLFFKDFKLSIWDVGGQVSIRTYWRNFFEQTDGLIWVIDSSDQSRLQACKVELHELLKQEKLAGATLLIFYNKSDIEGSMSLQQIKEFLDLDKIHSRHWAILPSSGVTGSGLYQGINWMVNDISDRIFMK